MQCTFCNRHADQGILIRMHTRDGVPFRYERVHQSFPGIRPLCVQCLAGIGGMAIKMPALMMAAQGFNGPVRCQCGSAVGWCPVHQPGGPVRPSY